MLSVLDLFRIGIGPSSSHTVGPIRIAARFASQLEKRGLLDTADRVRVELQGSLALTGAGHATPKGVLLGLMGLAPETLVPAQADTLLTRAHEDHVIPLNGSKEIRFAPDEDIVFAYDVLSLIHI